MRPILGCVRVCLLTKHVLPVSIFVRSLAFLALVSASLGGLVGRDAFQQAMSTLPARTVRAAAQWFLERLEDLHGSQLVEEVLFVFFGRAVLSIWDVPGWGFLVEIFFGPSLMFVLGGGFY